jgi:hypothetical protein
MKNKEFGKIKKVKDWLADKNKIDKFEAQLRKIMGDIFLQSMAKTLNNPKILSESEITSVINNKINSFLSEKNEKS